MKNRSRQDHCSLRAKVAGVVAGSCLVMIGFAPRATWSAEGINLAANPGFESTNFPGKEYLVQSKDHVRLVEDQPYEGKYCVRHDAAPGHDMNTLQMYEAMIPVKTGQIYRLAVQSRNTLRGAGPQFAFREANGEGNDYPGGGSLGFVWRRIPAGRPDWECYELILRPGAKTKYLQVYLCVPAHAESGSVW